MTGERVLVVGGGIAGLSCANAMGIHGCAVDVVELTGHVESESISLTGRSVDALADLGVLAECRVRANAQTDPVFGSLFDSAGNPRITPRPQEPHSALPAAIVINRPDLIDVLADAARHAGATVRTPATVTSIVQVADSVVVSFDDGTTGEYDLVVGADGVHSSVRGLVWGDGHRPAYTGAVGLRWTVGQVAQRGNRGFYYAPGRVVVVGDLPGEQVYVHTFADTDKVDLTQVQARDLLRGVLAAYTAPYLCQLRDRLDDTQRIVTRPWESFWLSDWYSGRVVLIGDAAHATAPYLPAGGGMALIDSVVLAEELSESDSIADGLAAFLHRRAERARLVVETSIEVTRLERENDPMAVKLITSALAALALPY